MKRKCEAEKATELIDQVITTFYHAMIVGGFCLTEIIDQIRIIVGDNIRILEEEANHAKY